MKTFLGLAVLLLVAHIETKSVNLKTELLELVRALEKDLGENVEEAVQKKQTPTVNQVLTQEQKDLIVDMHNRLRATVNPPATEMETMVWDDEVAAYAVEWAQCGSLWFEHREGANKYKSFGENLAIAMSSRAYSSEQLSTTLFEEALQGWWDEYMDYNYDENTCQPNKACGHYTQMAWAESNKIGCGFALHCPEALSYASWANNNFYLVCNYSPHGNVNGGRPYTEDTSASANANTNVNTNTNINSNGASTGGSTSTGGEVNVIPAADDPLATSIGGIGKEIRTSGGTANGAYCQFPFVYGSAGHETCIDTNLGSPWCMTNDGKWGYCLTEAQSQGEVCRDDPTYGESVMRWYLGGICPQPNSGYYWLINYVKASCGVCDCPTECINGRRDGSCGCKCDGGYIGNDCNTCGLDAASCKNGGTFDAATCSCSCPANTGGADCSVVDNPNGFNAEGNTFYCSVGWVINLCTCPSWSPDIVPNCPLGCNEIPSFSQLKKDSYLEDAGCTRSYTVTAGMRGTGGKSKQGLNTIEKCQERCNIEDSCLAVDFYENGGSPNGVPCVLHFSKIDEVNMVATAGASHSVKGWSCPGSVKRDLASVDVDADAKVHGHGRGRGKGHSGKKYPESEPTEPKCELYNNTCLNGATCKDCPRTPMGYKCICESPFKGTFCNVNDSIEIVTNLTASVESESSIVVEFDAKADTEYVIKYTCMDMDRDHDQPIGGKTITTMESPTVITGLHIDSPYEVTVAVQESDTVRGPYCKAVKVFTDQADGIVEDLGSAFDEDKVVEKLLKSLNK